MLNGIKLISSSFGRVGAGSAGKLAWQNFTQTSSRRFITTQPNNALQQQQQSSIRSRLKGFNRSGGGSAASEVQNNGVRSYILLGAGSSLLGIGALAWACTRETAEFNSSQFATSMFDEALVWPEHVHQRIRSTYAYLVGSIGLAGGSAYACLTNPSVRRLALRSSIPAALLTVAAMIGSGMLCRSLPYNPHTQFMDAKHAAWLLHSACIGFAMAPICLIGGPVLTRAAMYTCGIVGGLSCVAASSRSDRYLQMRGALSMGFGALFVASIGSLFTNPTSAIGMGLNGVIMWGGLVLFSGFLLYDTQKVVERAKNHPPPSIYNSGVPHFDPINNQMGIFMDSVNIFVRLAMLLSGGGKSKRR